MYCDFCGKQLASNVKYCRHCGRMQRNSLDDTMPVPVIGQGMLSRRQEAGPIQWSKLLLPKKTMVNKTDIWRKMYGIVALGTIVVMLYILATFETIKQYQLLTTIIGCLVVIYTWRKGKVRLSKFFFRK
ncbi:MAG: hypothetical protein H6Q71_671 [Firmicutes bacterium]|nr:hypothetical protein [Bacillota bacterium]